MINRFQVLLSNSTCAATGRALVDTLAAALGAGQGFTLVHFSAQPEPLLVTEATASVHFLAQPETFLPMKSPNMAHKECSRQAEKWTRVAHKKRLR
jgi:hypothetical protein